MEDIIDYSNNVTKLIEGFSLEDFEADIRTYYAVMKNIEIIGEAAYMLTREFRERHTDLPWSQIVSMRHHIVHGYYQVDESIVWDVIQEDLEPLKQQVEAILAETDWSEWEK